MSLQENVPFGTPLANLNMEVKDLDTAPNAVFEVNLGQISSHVFMIPESTNLRVDLITLLNVICFGFLQVRNFLLR